MTPPGSLRWRTLQLPSRVIASAFLATIGLVLIIGCLAEPAPPQTSPAREAETTPAVSQVESTVPDEAAEPPGVLTTQGADGAVRLSPLVGTLSHDALDWDDFDLIRGFSNTDQAVRWRARWIRPGEYRVVVISSATGPTAEARIRVSLKTEETEREQRVEGTLPLTEQPTEVARTPVGIMKIEHPGEALVTAQMIGLPLLGTFGLAGIDLEPVMTPEAGFVVPRSPADEP